MSKGRLLRFPVISRGAEHLVMGYLMRRNILTYTAPPNNEGYDLICIHPNLRACFKNQDWWFASRLDMRAIMVRWIMASPCSGFRS
jgi:hypothetical protein